MSMGEFADAPVPEDSGTVHPSVRGDSIIATWGVLALGHLFEAVFGVWALGWGRLPDRYDDATPAIAAVIVIMLLGWTGLAVTTRMLRMTLRIRLAAERHAEPPPVTPSPILGSSVFVIFAVCLGIMAVFLWGAVGVFPAVAIELMLIPLALRTERFQQDVAAAT